MEKRHIDITGSISFIAGHLIESLNLFEFKFPDIESALNSIIVE